MQPDLTPDQWAKIRRGWVPVAGHLYVDPADHHEWWRILAVGADGQIHEWVDCVHGCYTPEEGEWPVDAVPCFWGDDATADGLLRTARSMWRDENAYAMWSRAGKWKVFVHTGLAEHVFEGRAEADALIAAILVAPEPK